MFGSKVHETWSISQTLACKYKGCISLKPTCTILLTSLRLIEELVLIPCDVVNFKLTYSTLTQENMRAP